LNPNVAKIKKISTVLSKYQAICARYQEIIL